MVDYTKLSDDELERLIAEEKAAKKSAGSKPLSELSDAELEARVAAEKKSKSDSTFEARVAAEQEKTRKELDPTQGMGGVEKFIAGMGSGVADKWLGAKQLAASVGLGDKEALAKEAAEKARLDKPLLDTGLGTVGNVTGSLLPDLLLGGGAAAGATRLLPQTAKLARALTSAGVQGAEAGLLTPGEHYDPVKEGLLGAGLGIGGDVAARGVGRALRPIQSALPERVQEQVAQLSGMPGMLAENLSNKPWIRAMTNALAQLGPAGSGVNKARLEKLGAYTGEVTGAAGRPRQELTEAGWTDLRDRLAKQADVFRAGPDVELPANMSERLRNQLASIEETAGLAGKNAPGTLGRAAEAATPTAPAANFRPATAEADRPSILNTINRAFAEQENPRIVQTLEKVAGEMPGARRAAVPIPTAVAPEIPIRTADAIITARSIASDLKHSATNAGPAAVLEAKGAGELAKQLEEALIKTHPDGGQAFKRWKAEFGTSKDIEKVVNRKALTPEGHIKPEEFLSGISTPSRETPLGKRTIALAERAASPTLAENRSWNVRLLMGGIPGVGTAGGLFYGDDAKDKALGAGAGAAGSLYLAHMLLGTKHGGRYLTGQTESKLAKGLQSAELKKLLQMLGAARGGEFGGYLGKD